MQTESDAVKEEDFTCTPLHAPNPVTKGGSRERLRQCDFKGSDKDVVSLATAMLKMHIFNVHPCPPGIKDTISKLFIKAAKELKIKVAPEPRVVQTVRVGFSKCVDSKPTIQIYESAASVRGHFKVHVWKLTDKFYGLSNIEDHAVRTKTASKLMCNRAYIWEVHTLNY